MWHASLLLDDVADPAASLCPRACDDLSHDVYARVRKLSFQYLVCRLPSGGRSAHACVCTFSFQGVIGRLRRVGRIASGRRGVMPTPRVVHARVSAHSDCRTARATIGHIRTHAHVQVAFSIATSIVVPT